MDLVALLPKIKQLAVEAGGLVSEAAGGGNLHVHHKGPRDFVTRVDEKIHDFFCRRLPELLPGSMVVSEEGNGEEPPHAGCCWIIDPVDGTTNLIYQLPLYALSIGLLLDGRPVLGLVYNPVSGEMFSAVQGFGAYLGHRQIRVNADDVLARTLVLAETDPYFNRQRNRSPELIHAVFRRCIDYRITGSAALDICFIACGRGGAFFSQCVKPWDYAGGSVILLEAGGVLTQWDNTPLPFTGQHGILGTNGLLHREMLDRIGDFLLERTG